MIGQTRPDSSQTLSTSSNTSTTSTNQRSTTRLQRWRHIVTHALRHMFLRRLWATLGHFFNHVRRERLREAGV
jgi:hypothetical protein